MLVGSVVANGLSLSRFANNSINNTRASLSLSILLSLSGKGNNGNNRPALFSPDNSPTESSLWLSGENSPDVRLFRLATGAPQLHFYL